MLETTLNYDQQIVELQKKIETLRQETQELAKREKELDELKKRARREKLQQQNLAACSMFHTNSGLFPIAEIRYFYFSHYWARKDQSDQEQVLQRLCPEHFPQRPNSISTNEQNPNYQNITSEVQECFGRLILVVNGQDVSDIPVLERTD